MTCTGDRETGAVSGRAVRMYVFCILNRFGSGNITVMMTSVLIK